LAVARGPRLFDTAVDLRPAAAGPGAASGSQQVPLELALRGHRLELRHERGAADGTLARRLLLHTSHALEALVAASETPVDRISPLSRRERAELVTAGTVAAAYPSGHCLHQLVEEQVARTPGRTALVFGAERISYDELNRRANRLAGHLVALGVRPDSVVGLCAEPGLDLDVALLAI